MHILGEKFRKELVDIYTGKQSTCLKFEKIHTYIFRRVLIYLAENCYYASDKIDEVRKLIDAFADWTHNPTESELRKILDVEERVSGYGVTTNADEAIAAVAYCITHEIPGDFDVDYIDDVTFYRISFKNITTSQRDAIVKASCINLK